MNLNEYASALSENARKISLDNGPLVESMDLMVSTMEKVIANLSDPRLGEPMGQMLEEFKNQREVLVNRFPKEMNELKHSIVKSADETASHLRETQTIHEKGVEELRRLEEELAFRQQQPTETKYPPLPIEPTASPEPDFSPGDDLLQALLGITKPAPPVKQTIRTSGNIWEDWGKPAK